MSVLLGARPAVRVEAAGLASGVRIRWRVWARADGPASILEWRVRALAERAEGEAVLIGDGGERALMVLAHEGGGVYTRDGDLEHLDLPGAIRATIRVRPGLEVLYARTPLAGMMGIAGGCGELEGIAPL